MMDHDDGGTPEEKALSVDAAALARSRHRFVLALQAGMKLSEIAVASIGFSASREGQAALRAMRDEVLQARKLRRARRGGPGGDDGNAG